MWRALWASAVVSTIVVSGGLPAFAQGAAAPGQQPPARQFNSPAPLERDDAFGETVELPERTIVYFKGSGTWDKAFETIADAFKTVNQYLDKQNIKPTGPAMTIYTRTDNTGFDFRAALPVAAAPKDPPQGDIATGPAPAGKALKFVHRGSFDALDTTYEAITNYLDEKRLEARDIFIEEYAGDGLKNAEDRLVVNIFVPIK